jgi:hypothetical protein
LNELQSIRGAGDGTTRTSDNNVAFRRLGFRFGGVEERRQVVEKRGDRIIRPLGDRVRAARIGQPITSSKLLGLAANPRNYFTAPFDK